MHHDVTWYGGRPQPRQLCVRCGPRSSPQKGREDPQFSAHVYCGQTAKWIKTPLGAEVGLVPDDIMLDRHPAPPPERGRSAPPQFSVHVYCGQRAACIKMALGVEVGLGPGHIVVDGVYSYPPQKRGRAPNFRPMSIAAKRLYAS